VNIVVKMKLNTILTEDNCVLIAILQKKDWHVLNGSKILEN